MRGLIVAALLNLFTVTGTNAVSISRKSSDTHLVNDKGPNFLQLNQYYKAKKVYLEYLAERKRKA